MSGLIAFFSRFTSLAATTTTADDDDDHNAAPNNGGHEYGESLADKMEIDNDNDDEEGEEIVDNELPEFSETPLNYAEWKTEQRHHIQDYFMKRIMIQDDEDDEEDSSMLEDGPSATSVVPHIKDTVHSVTHLDDIDLYTKQVNIELAHVTRIYPLRDVNRPAVTKDFAYQPRYRPMLSPNQGQMTQLLQTPLECDGPLALIYPKDVVLTMELSQLLVQPNSPARRPAMLALSKAALPDNGDHPNDPTNNNNNDPLQSSRKIRVFFYGDYAQQLATLLDRPEVDYDPRKRKQSRLLLQLRNVPARCVFPYEYQHWHDQQEMATYCLCIGGNSRMTMTTTNPDNGNTERTTVRFDVENANEEEDGDNQEEDDDDDDGSSTDPLTIRLAVVEEGQARHQQQQTQQWTLQTNCSSSDTMDDKEMEVTKDTTTELDELYKTWKIRAGTPVEDEREEQQESGAAMGNERQAQQQTEQTTNTAGDSSAGRQAQEESTNPATTTTNRDGNNEQAAMPPPTTKSTTKYTPLADLTELLQLHRNRQASSRYSNSNNRGNNNCQANISAIVVGFTPPSQTKSGDYKMNVTLMDESMYGRGDVDGTAATGDDNAGPQEEVHPISLIIFCRRRSDLPALRCAGEVLRLHRVVVQEWNGDLQLRGQRSTGYVVYRGGSSDHRTSTGQASASSSGVHPNVMASPRRHSRAPEDEERLSALWKWGQTHFANHSTIKQSEQRRLGQIGNQDDKGGDDGPEEQNGSNSSGDFTVMISAIIPMPADRPIGITPCGFLRVWDGTGPSYSDRFPIGMGSSASRDGDPPSEALVAISKIKPRQDKDKSYEPPHRLCGRVVNVVIWEQEHWNTIVSPHSIPIGTFVRLRNVNEAYLKEIGLRCIHVRSNSWLTPLPPNNFDTLEVLLKHHERVSKRQQPNLSSGVLPLDTSALTESASRASGGAAHAGNRQDRAPLQAQKPKAAAKTAPRVPTRKPRVLGGKERTYSKLDFLRTKSEAAFKGRVVIKGTIPKISRPSQMQMLCPKGKDKGGRTYRFALRVTDGVTTMDAVVSNSVGESFFGGISAEDACAARAEDAFSVLSCIERGTPMKASVRGVRVKKTTFFMISSIAPESEP